MQTKQVILSEEMIEKVKIRATNDGRSFSGEIRFVLRKYYEMKDSEAEVKQPLDYESKK